MPLFFTSPSAPSENRIAKAWATVRHFMTGLRVREWMVLIIGVALSLTVFELMLASLNQRIDDQFQQDVDTIDSYMQKRLNTSLNMLVGLQAFTSVNSPITHEIFHKYVASLKLDTYFPGINNLNYAERVSADKKAALLRRLAKEYPDAKFVVSPDAEKQNKNSSATAEPKTRNDDALILSIIEPDDISALSIGKNLFSNPAIAKAIYASIRTNKPTSSGRLIQAESKGKNYIGIPIRLPVYKDGVPVNTEEQREAAYIGSVGAGINVESFLVTEDKEGLNYIKYQIFDDALLNAPDSHASTLKNLIFDSTYIRANVNAAWPPSIKIRHAPFMTTRTLQISGDKSYRVVFTANGPAIPDISLQYPFFAAASVLLITLLVFIQLRSSTIATQNAEHARVLADQANVAKSRFLANMSHEIRTPMNAVLGMLSLLLDSNLTGKQAKFASLAYDSAESLMVIINDILDFSKIEAGKLSLEKISFDLVSLVESVVDSQEQAAIEKGIKLDLHYIGNIPGPLMGDPTRIRQVLTNLLNNAIKFTVKGSVLLQVETQMGAHENCLLTLSVIDTGIGLPPEKIEEVFHEFTQADDSTTRQYGGTGLGLSICKSLIEMMGSKISVSSQVGQGSSFSFTLDLPLASKNAPSAALPAISAGPGNTSNAFSGKRILVAEDNKANQIVITHMLKALGCTVDIAADGQQAVDMHLSNQYDLVFMDCLMPTLDGFDATMRIRASENTAKRTPIIALTAHSLPENREKCIAAGMDDFISKPVIPATLHNALTRWLHGDLAGLQRSSPAGADIESNNYVAVRNMIGRIAFDDAASVFVNEFAPQKIAALRKAMDAGNLQEIISIAHVITGSASILGANLLSRLCRDLEQQTKSQQGVQNAQAKITAIEKEYSLVESQLRAILANDQHND